MSRHNLLLPPGVVTWTFLFGGLALLAAIVRTARPHRPLRGRLLRWAALALLLGLPLRSPFARAWLVYAPALWPESVVLLDQGPDPDTALLLAMRGEVHFGRALLWQDGRRSPIGPSGVFWGQLGPRGAVALESLRWWQDDFVLTVLLASGAEARCPISDDPASSWRVHEGSFVWRDDGEAYAARSAAGVRFEDEGGCTLISGATAAGFIGRDPAWIADGVVFVAGEALDGVEGATELLPVRGGLLATGPRPDPTSPTGRWAWVARVHRTGLEPLHEGHFAYRVDDTICARPKAAPMTLFNDGFLAYWDATGPASCWRGEGPASPSDAPGSAATRPWPAELDSQEARLLPDGRARLYRHFGYFEATEEGVSATRFEVDGDVPFDWREDLTLAAKPLGLE